MESPRLTQFSPGAGCGCKISPAQLKQILSKNTCEEEFASLLVGNDHNDDAAVFDLGNGTAVVSTTDFFTPIVDDPYDFGRIAATNAISDVYAMGGNPLMAIAILGWPLEKLSTDAAAMVINGARQVCQLAGIPLAGGHSIDISDPVFGLAVTGLVEISHLKRNSSASAECDLFLTKPIGVGIVTTAEKRGLVYEEDRLEAIRYMTTLNVDGSFYGNLDIVEAITDVTGFGLGGHLLEMCEGSGLDGEIQVKNLPLLHGLERYLKLNTIPGGTQRNYKSYGSKISEMSPELKNIICDPQTSGGLLVAVRKGYADQFRDLSAEKGFRPVYIGRLVPSGGNQVRINLK
jgi:selenide, water dikinase